MRSWIGFAVMLLAAPCCPPAPLDLAWKFQPGATFYLERVYRQKMAVEVMGKVFEQVAHNTWMCKVVVDKIEPEGARLDVTIVKIVHKGAGSSAAPVEANLVEKLAGSRFAVDVSPAGRVRGFSGYDNMVKKVAGNAEERAKAIRFLFPEAGLRDGFEEALGFLPDGPAAAAAAWKRRAEEPMPPFGTLQAEFTYRLLDTKDGQAKIAFDLEMSYRPPTEPGLLFRVVEGRLKTGRGSGTIVFDGARGRLVQGERRVLLKGELKIEAAAKQTALEFSSENALSWRILDKLP